MNFNEWLTKNLERFAIYVSTAAIAACSYMLWENYKTNQNLAQLLQGQDVRVRQLEREVAENKAQISELRSQMVGWDVLKRIELFLATLPPEKSSKAMADALRVERESRR